MPSSQKSRWVLTPSVIRTKPELSCVRMQEQAFILAVWKRDPRENCTDLVDFRAQAEKQIFCREARQRCPPGARTQTFVRFLSPQINGFLQTWGSWEHRGRLLANILLPSVCGGMNAAWDSESCLRSQSWIWIQLSHLLPELMDPHLSRDEQQISFWAGSLYLFGEQLIETHHWLGEIDLIQAKHAGGR